MKKEEREEKTGWEEFAAMEGRGIKEEIEEDRSEIRKEEEMTINDKREILWGGG